MRRNRILPRLNLQYLPLIGSLLVIATLFSTVQAQNRAARHGQIHIEWKDQHTKQPVEKGRVEICPLSEGPGIILETDSKGRASHIRLPEGGYVVFLFREGYAPVEITDVLVEDHYPVRVYVKSLNAEEAPYKRKLIRYQRAQVQTDSSEIRTIMRSQ
jgi:hypothetical protein